MAYINIKRRPLSFSLYCIGNDTLQEEERFYVKLQKLEMKWNWKERSKIENRGGGRKRQCTVWLHRHLNFTLMNLWPLRKGRVALCVLGGEEQPSATALRFPLNVVSYRNEGLHSASYFTEFVRTKLFSDFLRPAYVTCRWQLSNLWLSPGKFSCRWLRCLANGLAQRA